MLPLLCSWTRPLTLLSCLKMGKKYKSVIKRIIQIKWNWSRFVNWNLNKVTARSNIPNSCSSVASFLKCALRVFPAYQWVTSWTLWQQWNPHGCWRVCSSSCFIKNKNARNFVKGLLTAFMASVWSCTQQIATVDGPLYPNSFTGFILQNWPES